MRIHSDSFEPGQPIPARYAAGAPDGFGGNRNPHLAWDDVPEGTRAFALLCIDPDAPTDPSLAGKDGVEIPVEHPRGPFVHWVMVDLASELRSIAEGSASDGVTKGGKRTPPGPDGARQGLNDYTGWFAGDPDMAGDWFGYDGPYPPPNDLRTHRYFFRLFALDVAQLELPERFTAGDVQRAMQGHVLAEASVWGSYALHPQAQPA
ncbi:YbhB/YbcL family Raf kinase inhibitor-like protein [Lysobacteraceae bacterium NML93-0792]|nr:YbhB/YbcL family Raf kinase inhibitor-like protein [Xanthomonadaceae bacterium NML93-0792]PBS14743.1 YbhB/YbcL family Raf kinase inhibitor-like protein [Xanthomonadaceae bacterium NML93-0793]PBS17757.1 YbhB/YbcL family Raf kinase inhibitor-like protein [Xanthomonadaceae bacterium NML93-0831]